MPETGLHPQLQRRDAIPLGQIVEQILHQRSRIHLAKPNRHPSNRHGHCAKRFDLEPEFLQIIKTFEQHSAVRRREFDRSGIKTGCEGISRLCHPRQSR